MSLTRPHMNNNLFGYDPVILEELEADWFIKNGHGLPANPKCGAKREEQTKETPTPVEASDSGGSGGGPEITYPNCP